MQAVDRPFHIDQLRVTRAEESRFCRLLAWSLMLNARLLGLNGADVEEKDILEWIAAASGDDLELPAWQSELLDQAINAKSGRDLLRAWDQVTRVFGYPAPLANPCD